MKKRYVITLLVSMTVLLFTYGCSSNKQSVAVKETDFYSFTYILGSNDWSSLTPFKPIAKTIEAYQFAADHPEVLDYMPCYCGCFEDAGHINNTDCFVQSVTDNVAILDNMGLGWGICVDIAREAKMEYEKGTDLTTIRNIIDTKYGANGVAPTPTPMP